MFKRLAIASVVVIGGLAATAPADAGIFSGRVAPVRRVVARAVLPPVVRHTIVAPVYRPYVRPAYGRAIYGGPAFYRPGISVGIGF